MSKDVAQNATPVHRSKVSKEKVPVTAIQPPAGAIAKAQPKTKLDSHVNLLLKGYIAK